MSKSIANNINNNNNNNTDNLPTKTPAIGIDLGTSSSCVAVFEFGKVEIITNDHGHRTTPSYVAFTDHERLIGEAAKSQIARNPSNTIYDSKRLIGRRFEEETVQNDMKHWPFTVINHNGQPKVQVQYQGETRSFFAEEISSMILGKMKETAEAYLGRPVTDAVITVPAYFNHSQRRATIDAGKIAGLNIREIINEPTAAAIAYGLERRSPNKRLVLIFDLGGGTFDVSILRMEGGTIDVIATSGDPHLGGEDFDNRMVAYFAEEFKRTHDRDLTRSSRALRRLKMACEEAKKTLSFASQASLELDVLYDQKDLYSVISRAKFEDLCNDLFRKTLDVLDRVLEDSNLDKTDIDDVVLVGGSTRIPKIQRLLQNYFEGKELNRSINPDEAIAYGAAVKAAKLNGDDSGALKDLILREVLPLSLGVDGHSTDMNVIIPRNTPIPIKKTVGRITCEDNQTWMRFRIYQGERPLTKDNHLIGQLTLEGLEPAPRGKTQVDLTFEVDGNGVLKVTAVDRKTGTKDRIEITIDEGRLTQDQIERMLDQAKRSKADDDRERDRIAARLALETCALRLRENYRLYGLSKTLEKKIRAQVDETLNWLDNNKEAAIHIFKERHEYLRKLAQSYHIKL